MNVQEGLDLSHRVGPNLCDLNSASCENCLKKECAAQWRDCLVTAVAETPTETAKNNAIKLAWPAFEDILDIIQSRGKFQSRLNIVLCYFGAFFTMMCVHVYYIAMQTPDHWCHVPGREYTNLSREEWKIITIPKEDTKFSNCMMFDINGIKDSTNSSIISCQHGWDYDDTWFSQTIPSQMNWVCDQSQVTSNVMFYAQISGTILVLFFGYVGDMFGRRPQIILCLSTIVMSRLMLVLIPSVVLLFIFAQSLAAGATGPFFESLASIGLELTDIQYRSSVNRNSWVSICLGLTFAGLVAWVFRNWQHFFLFTTFFCFILLLSFSWWLPESPRWLACRGRQRESLSVLRRIAATNGTTVPPFTSQVLRRLADSKGETRGFLSVFSSWNLLKNTLILVISRAVISLTIYSVVLSVGVLSVHPFVTIAAEGVAQVAAVLVVHCYGSRIGRRWSSVAALLLSAATSAAIATLLHVGAPGIVLMLAVTILQFVATAALTMANLQSLEIHPTCLRQITTSIEMAFVGLVLSLVPYVILMGGSVDQRLPFAIIAGVNVLAAFLASFLPESALQKLPETLRDAAVFGRGRPYWSWRPSPAPSSLSEGERPVTTARGTPSCVVSPSGDGCLSCPCK